MAAQEKYLPKPELLTEPTIVRCPQCGVVLDVADLEQLVRHIGPHKAHEESRALRDGSTSDPNF